MHKTIITDIDGILNYYPACWVDYINTELGTKFKSKEEAKRYISLKAYKCIKDKYRNSTYKETLPINHDGLNLLEKLNIRNYHIIIATSRPIEDPNYNNLKTITMNWLNYNKVPYSDIIYKDKETSFLNNYQQVEFVIEDEIEYAKLIAAKNTKVFLYSYNNESLISHHNIIAVNNLSAILNYL